MAAPPSRDAIAGTPTNAQAKAGFGALWDYVTGLLGSTGNATEARVALGLPGDGQIGGMRNKVINGKMEIAQDGTVFSNPGTGTYTVDQWQAARATTVATVDVSQSTDVPAGSEFQYSLRATVTGADAAVAAGDLYALQQPIEGYNVRDLVGRAFTLRFRVRSSKTGTHCVALRNGVGDRSYVMEYTVNAANTWEDKSVTIPGGLTTAGTWNWSNGAGLLVGFVLMAGSTYQTVAGAWQTGSYLATAGQVNCLDTVGNIFAITGVQLEVGSVATPFEHRPYGAELALCQRYYEKSNGYGSGVGYCVFGNRGGDGTVLALVFFKMSKRVTPTMTYEGFGATFTAVRASTDAAYSTATTTSPGSVGLNYIAAARL